MIFILRREEKTPEMSKPRITYQTLAIIVPELEAALEAGGFNGDGSYEVVELLGVEIGRRP